MPEKQRYLSKTVRGSIMVLVGLILNQAGVDFTPEEQNVLVDHILEIVGAFTAIYGRVTAKTVIKKPSRSEVDDLLS